MDRNDPLMPYLRETYMQNTLARILGTEPRPFKWTQNFSDQLALNHFPEELLRRLQRYCDLNPVGAEDLVRFAVDIFDAGREDAIDEIATGGRR